MTGYVEFSNALAQALGSNFTPYTLKRALEDRAEQYKEHWRHPHANKGFWADRYLREAQRIRKLRKFCNMKRRG